MRQNWQLKNIGAVTNRKHVADTGQIQDTKAHDRTVKITEGEDAEWKRLAVSSYHCVTGY
jgi:hypothetical protein